MRKIQIMGLFILLFTLLFNPNIVEAKTGTGIDYKTKDQDSETEELDIINQDTDFEYSDITNNSLSEGDTKVNEDKLKIVLKQYINELNDSIKNTFSQLFEALIELVLLFGRGEYIVQDIVVQIVEVEIQKHNIETTLPIKVERFVVFINSQTNEQQDNENIIKFRRIVVRHETLF